MGGTLVWEVSLATSLNILMANEELSHRIPNNNWSLREMERRGGEGRGYAHTLVLLRVTTVPESPNEFLLSW